MRENNTCEEDFNEPPLMKRISHNFQETQQKKRKYPAHFYPSSDDEIEEIAVKNTRGQPNYEQAHEGISSSRDQRSGDVEKEGDSGENVETIFQKEGDIKKSISNKNRKFMSVSSAIEEANMFFYQKFLIPDGSPDHKNGNFLIFLSLIDQDFYLSIIKLSLNNDLILIL